MQHFMIYGLERLEDRVLLAVNVTFNRGTVFITSDGDDDYVALFEYDGDLIVGVDEDNDGTFDDYYDFDLDAIRKIDIKMWGGDDYVYVSDVDASGVQLHVDLGDGDDTFYTGYFAAYFAAYDYTGGGYNAIGACEFKDITIHGKDGDDDIVLSDTSTTRRLFIDTGDGNDEVEIVALFDDVRIGGNSHIHLGDGEYDDLEIYTGYGATMDFIGHVHIHGHADYTEVDIGIGSGGEGGPGGDLTFHDHVHADFQPGGDTNFAVVAFADSDVVFEDKFQFNGGTGDDDVYMIAVDGSQIVFDGDVKLDGRGGDNFVIVEADEDAIEFNGKVKVKNFDAV